ncbi:hypothetical protein [Aliidiomarina shirensis]|uniref:hypothetical protein n=1 Tax=Aliidiomarina shirensis TaxID=1048642 RepID=UPI000F86CD3A|nr:hypothetical protein [Aliidiomarina shirensis]
MSDFKVSLQEHFNPIPELQHQHYASRLDVFILLLLEINYGSAETRHGLEDLRTSVMSHCNAASTEYVRRDFYSSLKSHSFFSTLMLIPEPAPNEPLDSNTLRSMALLARVYALRGVDDYSAYLQFYKCFISEHAPEVPLTRRFIIESTDEELQLELKLTSELDAYRSFIDVVPYLQPRTPTTRDPSKKGLIRQPNMHKQRIQESDSYDVNYLQFTNENADTFSEILEVTPKITLSTEQQRRKFRRREAGARNALYKHEAKVSWSLQAAMPSEFQAFIDAISPELIDGHYADISSDNAKFLSVLFLNVLGISNVLDIVLINLGARNDAAPSDIPRLEYELDRKTKYIEARIVINASLLSTNVPEFTAGHYTHNPTLNYVLPHPLPALLNIALRNTNIQARHKYTIANAFALDPTIYNKKINDALKASKLKARGITRGALEKAFHYFAADSVPEVFLSFLTQSASVQNHYVSAERASLQEVITSEWLRFIRVAGFHHTRLNTTENASLLGNRFAFHDEVGSKITIRQELIDFILERLSHSLSTTALTNIADHISALNHCAFYLYMRVATTSALRPVQKPFPLREHFHASLGAFSVADKRSHHAEERRVIILSPMLRRIICAYQSTADCISEKLNISKPCYLVMHLNGETRCFEHFSRALVNTLFLNITEKPFINHSFRHSAARRFLTHHVDAKTFSQAALNVLMNHSRAGVSALNARSLTSVADNVSIIQKRIEAYDSIYDASDMAILKVLHKISGTHDAAWD